MKTFEPKFCEECPFYHEVDHKQGTDEHCGLGYTAPKGFRPWEEKMSECSISRIHITE